MHVVDKQDLIHELEAQSTLMENIKNEKIELIPKLPCQCRISIKERIAPLALKFEFFNLNTMERVPRTDVIVSIDPRNKHPTP